MRQSAITELSKTDHAISRIIREGEQARLHDPRRRPNRNDKTEVFEVVLHFARGEFFFRRLTAGNQLLFQCIQRPNASRVKMSVWWDLGQLMSSPLRWGSRTYCAYAEWTVHDPKLTCCVTPLTRSVTAGRIVATTAKHIMRLPATKPAGKFLPSSLCSGKANGRELKPSPPTTEPCSAAVVVALPVLASNRMAHGPHQQSV
jgi:hypothetical protein